MSENNNPNNLHHGGEFLNNEWYVIIESSRLRKRPLTVERLGRQLVLWRDRDGNAVAQDARCPHRGANLGLGRVVNGQLECPYHGFRFAANGACTHVPCEGSKYRIPAQLSVRRYPIRERFGLVWLWLGADATIADALPPLPWFDELPADVRGTATQTMVWKVPFRRVMEGMLDIHHLPFAHRAVAPGIGARLDPYEVEHSDGVIRTRGVLRADDGPYQGKGGLSFGLTVRFPGLMLGEFNARVRLLAAMTPIDQNRTWIVYRYYVAIPVVGGLLARLAVLLEDRLVQPDDERMLLSSTPIHFDTSDHGYVPADRGILIWHKLYRKRIRTQRAHQPARPAVIVATPPGGDDAGEAAC